MAFCFDECVVPPSFVTAPSGPLPASELRGAPAGWSGDRGPPRWPLHHGCGPGGRRDI